MTNHAVAVFVGRQQQFGIKTTEFKSTLNKIGCTTHQFFVDVTKTWYNQPGVYETLYDQLDTFISNNHDKQIVFMGSSMGGFGAILFAKAFPQCTKVIAFSPQIHIDPKLTQDWDKRYVDNVKHLDVLSYPSVCDKLRTGVQYDILYGSEEPRDTLQLDKLIIGEHHNCMLHKIDGAGHNVPAELKRRNQLESTLLELL